MIRTILRQVARALGLRYRYAPPNFRSWPHEFPDRGLKGGRRVHGGAREASPGRPLVSIVTAVRNGEASLRRTIDSVRRQSYDNIEYIVVDGASSDGTLAIIKENEDCIDLWTSEPDAGIYDAFNKGVMLATGDFVAFLNSDDYYEPHQIELAVETLQSTSAEWVFGDVVLHGWRGMCPVIGGDPLYAMSIRRTMPSVSQASVLAKRSLFEAFGLFRTEYRIAGDYDWFLRITNGGAKGVYDNRILAHMSSGGISTSNQRRAIIEGYLICVRNGYPLVAASLHWGARFIFPNGIPAPASQIFDRLRGVRAALYLRVRFIQDKMRKLPRAIASRTKNLLRSSSVETTKPSEIEFYDRTDREAILTAFLAARQLGGDLDEQTLVCVAEMSHRYQRFAVVGDEPVCQQAKIMLQVGSQLSQTGVKGADLVALSTFAVASHASLLKGKTVIVLPVSSRRQEMQALPQLSAHV